MEFDGRLEFDMSTAQFLASRDLELGGRVQTMLDMAVYRYCFEYVPYDTGALARSPLSPGNDIGVGEVRYSTPYAARLYYNPQYDFNLEVHPLAGGYWFERAMGDHRGDILKEVSAFAGCKHG